MKTFGRYASIDAVLCGCGSIRLGSVQDRHRDIPLSCAPENDTQSTKSREQTSP
ncbi:hypothetical protein Hdeb2414_s0016g00479291 [Helianthus debilis subsp. tardiflorus]